MTVILLCGLPGAGKSIIAEELVNHHGYKRLHFPKKHDLQPSTGDFENLSINENGSILQWDQSVEEAVDFVTGKWQENFVITGLYQACQFQAFLIRPFCMILAVLAPTLRRFERCHQRNPELGLAEFIKSDDQALYGKDLLVDVFPRARLTIANGGDGIDRLCQTLRNLCLDERWTRPQWDAYFMEMAELASKRSNCMKRGVGCLIVKDLRVVATGYNGTPSGLINCCEGGCGRCNGNARCGIALETCLCLHAEDNALLEAGRLRCVDGTLYCTTAPCLSCSTKLIQCGIRRIVYAKEYSIAHDASLLLKEASVELVKFTRELPHFIDVDQQKYY